MAKRSEPRKGKKDDGESDWQRAWDARQAFLESLFGRAERGIYTSLFPIYLGGNCDVLTFKKHGGKGCAYATAGLTVTSDQRRSKLGQYELVVFTRKPDKFVPGLLSQLSHYTLDHPIQPFDTIGMGEQPKGVTLRALLALEFDPPRGRFKLMGKTCGLLLLVGITEGELAAYRAKGRREVLAALDRSVLPYTDPKRTTVIEPAARMVTGPRPARARTSAAAPRSPRRRTRRRRSPR